MNRITRKPNRLSSFNYSTPGVYFITICTADRKCILSTVEGGGVLDAPFITLKPYGVVAENVLNEIEKTYSYLTVEKHVIMPNHIHMLVRVSTDCVSGSSRTPTPANMMIPRFVSTFKRFCNKQYRKNIWQRSYDDRVIRSEAMYRKVWEYIDTNPHKWQEDRYYRENGLYLSETI